MPSDNTSPSLNPLDSPAQQPQDPPPSTLSAQETQERADLADPMVKLKRRMFSTPLLRRSATASSAAAASAASRIKSNLSTVTKLPTALKRTANHKTTVDRAPTIPSLSRSSTDSSVKQEGIKRNTTNNNRKFGIPSLMRIRTGSKELKPVTEGPLDSSEEEHSSRGNNSEEEAETNEAKSAANSASRFVMGVPAMLRRVVSNNQTPPNIAALQKKSPDTSANSTPRGDSPQDEWDENDRHSLLMMMQVPEDQRRSQIPLMAASEAW